MTTQTTTPPLRTLADVKRRVTRDTALVLTYHRLQDAQWGTADRKCPLDVPRAVVKAQTNAVALELNPGSGDGKTSWLTWPKARDIQITDPDTFTIYEDGEPFMTYRIEPAS